MGVLDSALFLRRFFAIFIGMKGTHQKNVQIPISAPGDVPSSHVLGAHTGLTALSVL